MFTECPNPAYYRIIESGIVNEIIERKELIHDILLFQSPYFKEGIKSFSWAEKVFYEDNRMISEKSEMAKDILEMETVIDKEDYYAVSDFENALLEHPSFLGKLVLGQKILKPKKYGFNSRRSLEEAITSFILGEKYPLIFRDDKYIWRQEDFKNEIILNMHGDLYASQVDVSGREEKNLFGEDEFDTIKRNVVSNGISAYQDWSQFLVATLRYAKSIGKENISEIIHWKDVLEKEGCVGTNTAECLGGSGGMEEMNIKFLMDFQVLEKDKELKSLPLFIPYRDIRFIPYIEDEKLTYLRESDSGDIIFPEINFISYKKFSRGMSYCEKDIPHILKATYKYFARDKSLLPMIMNSFLEEIK